MDYQNCMLCPRRCGVDRRTSNGYCKREPVPRSPGGASFLGRALHQRNKRQRNRILFRLHIKMRFLSELSLSHENFGREITETRLSEIFLELQIRARKILIL